MKFCTKCGHEINDEAIICTSCGCAVTSTPTATPTATATPVSSTIAQPASTSSTLLTAFNFVFTLVTAFCVFFLALAVVDAGVSTYISYYSSSVYSSFHLDYDLATVAAVFAFPAFSFGIVSFVLALVKKVKLNELFASISRMVIGLLLVILSLYIVG